MSHSSNREADVSPVGGDKGDEREGRAFALTLAVGFGFLALVGYWKDVDVITIASLALAVASLLAATFVPGRLGPIRTAWMKLGEILGRVTTPVLMAIVYYVVVTPIAIVRRAVRPNASNRNSYWHPHSPPSEPSRMERQF